MTQLFNRKYQLTIGSGAEAVIITELRVTFNVEKSANAKDKQDKCEVCITNLHPDTIQKVNKNRYNRCTFGAGYDGEIIQLFSGEIVECVVDKSGTDTETKLTIKPAYSNLNHKIMRGNVPPGKTVREVVEQIMLIMPDVARGVYAGVNVNKRVVYGYPLSGSPRHLLDDLARSYQIDWRIDQDVLYINDIVGATNTTKQAVLISKSTGMVDAPKNDYKTEGRTKEDRHRVKGVNVKMLLNGTIKTGSYVKIEHEEFNGFYKVEELKHSGDYRGADWTTELYCKAI